MTAHNTRGQPVGEARRGAKLTRALVLEAVAAKEGGEVMERWAAARGLHPGTVRTAVNAVQRPHDANRTTPWKWLGFELAAAKQGAV